MRVHAVLLSLVTVMVLVEGAWAARPAELRGIWMHATQVKTPQEADTLLDKIDRANLNAVFMLVWYWGGQAFFQNDLCPMGDGVQSGYDPLGYMVQQCHKRDIQLHAWFVNGAYGQTEPKHVLDKHPDWAVEDGAGGGSLWYDLGKPEVRRFQSDLMIACLSRYDVDGLHFDYIRYDRRQCYCDYCQQGFAARYRAPPLSEYQQKFFPTAAGISANPLTSPTSALVLATLSDGTPAIAANEVGNGTTLLLNWHAENEMPPAVAETLKIILGLWSMGNAKIYITTTDANRDQYGTDSLEAARVSLTRLGYRPTLVPAEQIRQLPLTSVLVLPAVYIIPETTANDIEQFVWRGSKLLIIDGPVKSMHLPAMRRLTGFGQTGSYMHRDDVIQSTGRNRLVPRGEHQVDLVQWKRRMEAWAEYRKAGVTELVRDVYRRAKRLKPDVQVTAAVFSSLERADEVYQDWPRWLQYRIVDYVIPMAYTEDVDELARQMAGWKTIDRQLQRIIPGLSIYQKVDGKTTTRDLDLIRRQYQLCRRQGAQGTMYFSLHYLSDPLIDVFRTELYPAEAPPDTPPLRRVP